MYQDENLNDLLAEDDKMEKEGEEKEGGTCWKRLLDCCRRRRPEGDSYGMPMEASRLCVDFMYKQKVIVNPVSFTSRKHNQ